MPYISFSYTVNSEDSIGKSHDNREPDRVILDGGGTYTIGMGEEDCAEDVPSIFATAVTERVVTSVSNPYRSIIFPDIPVIEETVNVTSDAAVWDHVRVAPDSDNAYGCGTYVIGIDGIDSLEYILEYAVTVRDTTFVYDKGYDELDIPDTSSVEFTYMLYSMFGCTNRSQYRVPFILETFIREGIYATVLDGEDIVVSLLATDTTYTSVIVDTDTYDDILNAGVYEMLEIVKISCM